MRCPTSREPPPPPPLMPSHMFLGSSLMAATIDFGAAGALDCELGADGCPALGAGAAVPHAPKRVTSRMSWYLNELRNTLPITSCSPFALYILALPRSAWPSVLRTG